MEKYNTSSALLISKKSFRNFIPFRILILFTFHISLLTIYSQPVTQEWVKRWPESSPASSHGISIKQDNQGFIYVLADTGNGFGFLKYNSNGYLLLHATYWPGGSYTYGWGEFFDVTGNGNVYITGRIYIGTNNWIYTVKFNSGGVFQWGKFYNNVNICSPSGIEVDGVDNVIIAGGEVIGTDGFALTLKYNSYGDTLWTRHFNQPPQEAGNYAFVLDNMNNIYTTGSLGLPGKCYILKYDPNGNLEWFTTFTLDPMRTTIGHGISVDNNGNVYVMGTQIRPQSQTDTYLLKLNNNGDTLWSRSYPRYGTGNNSLWGPVVSSDGNSIYYTGSFRDTVGSGYNIVTLKYNSIGDLQWAKIYNGGIPDGLNLPASIKLDRYNNIYVCGTGYYTTTGNDFLTLRYSPGGNLQWTMTYAGVIANGHDGAYDLMVDTNLFVYVSGESKKITNNGRDAVTIKYNQPSGIISNSNEIPNQYSLSQNYLNPFNPKSKIKFQIAKLSNVKLTVFDVLGREIAVLANQELKPGTYKVDFDGSNYPSGVYFYNLEVEDYTETKKMVLFK